ncbi:MAG TPA: hypothetical protein VJ828_09180 [Lacipirellulaceae bacterium]|jgi:hypothetical protein|nr:hypothetical protein [Lacipirellulaceae bacterium]HJS09200.1 hypothetical protein [Pirellulales bacterium]
MKNLIPRAELSAGVKRFAELILNLLPGLMMVNKKLADGLATLGRTWYFKPSLYSRFSL